MDYIYLNPRFQTTHPEEILFCAHTHSSVIQPNFLFHDYRPVLMNPTHANTSSQHLPLIPDLELKRPL